MAKRGRKRTWWKDPSVKGVFGPCPPANHPRRCQSPNRFGEQCTHWARKGADYCKSHGSYNRFYNRPMNWYARRATTKLAERLGELAEVSPNERMSLKSEIDIARELCAQALNLYDRAHYGEKEVDSKLKFAAQEALRNALNQVSQTVTSAARVHTMSSAVVEVIHLDWIAAQFTKIIEDNVLPFNEQIAAKCLDELSKVKIPVAQQDVGEQMREALRSMDDSVADEEMD